MPINHIISVSRDAKDLKFELNKNFLKLKYKKLKIGQVKYIETIVNLFIMFFILFEKIRGS